MIKGIKGIHHTAISVPSLAAAEEFYCTRLGLRKVLRWDFTADAGADRVTGLDQAAAKTMMVDAGNCYLEFFEFSSPEPAVQRDRPVCDHGYTHIAFDVDPAHVENVYRELEAAGVRWHCKLSDGGEDDGSITMTYGRDPFGNVIEIQALRSDNECHMHRLNGGQK